MTPSNSNNLMAQPQAPNRGGNEAAQELLAVVYKELRGLAGHCLRKERPDHTLQPTALVHEAYLRLIDQDVCWRNRSHFLGLAAQAMRRILIDHARARSAAKRGSAGFKMSLDELIDISDEKASELVALDEAMNELATFDPQKSRIVEMRLFGGLSIDETARELGISTASVTRQWKMARAWLYQRVTGGSGKP